MSDNTPTTVAFTPKEIEFLRSQAVHYAMQIPAGACLPGSNSELTQPEILALAWLNASIDLLAKKGCGVYIKPRLDEPSTEPDTEW